MENWTQVGLAHTEGKQDEIRDMIASMKWQKVEDVKSLPLMPSMGINQAIKEFGIPNVSEIAISHDLALYGLYGIHGHYANADARLYFVDEGVGITPILQVIEEKEGVL